MSDAEVVDRFLDLSQRVERLGGKVIVAKTAKGARLFETLGFTDGLRNTLYQDLDELEKFLPNLERTLPDYVPDAWKKPD